MGEVANLTAIRDVVTHPRATELLAKAKGSEETGLSGEALLSFIDELAPGTKTGGEIGRLLGTRLGLKAKSERRRIFPGAPYGHLVLAVLCTLARQNMNITELTEPNPGRFVVKSTTPSSIWSFAGEAVFVATATGAGFDVQGVSIARGQLFDWGRGRRLLNAVFDGMESALRTYATLDL